MRRTHGDICLSGEPRESFSLTPIRPCTPRYERSFPVGPPLYGQIVFLTSQRLSVYSFVTWHFQFPVWWNKRGQRPRFRCPSSSVASISSYFRGGDEHEVSSRDRIARRRLPLSNKLSFDLSWLLRVSFTIHIIRLSLFHTPAPCFSF